MRALRPRALLATCRVFACLLILHVCVFGAAIDGLGAQAKPTAVARGSMQTSGDVSLNGIRAAGEQTVYEADVVHTGADGMAVVSLSGGAMLSIGNNTDLSFGGSNYIALVTQGTVEIRSTQAGKNLVLEFGKWLMYVPSYATQASARLVVGADGSARVESRTGSLGLTAQSGNAVSFLNPGQSITVGADGKLGQLEGAPGSNGAGPAAKGRNSPAGVVKGSRTGYIILGAAAGGGAVAAGIVLGTRHHSSTSTPVSPSAP